MSKHEFRGFNPMPPQRPPSVALDRLGKLIEAGHLILFHGDADLIFEVVSVSPALNPAVQGGQAMQVIIKAEFPVQVMPALPNRGMVIIGETKARQEAKARNNGQPAEPSRIVGLDGQPLAAERADDEPAAVADPPESAQPCGCDPGAGWVCEVHRTKD